MENKFDTWAILELMGHRRLAGKVTEAAIGGGSFIRIDVPGKEDGVVATQFYSPSAIYCITPTTEEIARGVAASCHMEPVHQWEMPLLKPPAGVCWFCGCTEDKPCLDSWGKVCHWVKPGLCSSCATGLLEEV